MLAGEQLSSVPLDAMEEVVVEPGASSASAAADSDDSLSQPSSIALVESIDEALVPDIIAGTTLSSGAEGCRFLFSSHFDPLWTMLVTQRHF